MNYDELTVTETADLLGVSRRTVDRLIKSGELPCVWHNPRVLRICRVDIGVYYAKKRGKCQQVATSPDSRNFNPETES